MREVKLLIQALTTERNAIDRAIAALGQMSDAKAKPVEQAKPRKKAKSRAPWTPERRAKMDANVARRRALRALQTDGPVVQ